MARDTYEQKKERVFRAIRKEKNDRVPLIFMGPNVPFAKYANPETTVADVYENPIEYTEIALNVLDEKFPNTDIAGMVGGISGVYTAGAMWLSGTNVPGRELPRDISHQIVECNSLLEEDYDRILNEGWMKIKNEIVYERLGYDPEVMKKSGPIMFQLRQMGIDHGYFEYDVFPPTTTYDKICSGRGLSRMARDIRKNPDKMEAVLNVVLEEELEGYKKMIAGQAGKIASICPANRANCDNISRATFERFAWPAFQAFANAALDEGLYLYFHMDSNWTDFLDYFTCFPKDRCIFDTDGMTDMDKVHEIIGPTMAMTGAISSTLLTVGNPDDVYNECRRQIEAYGPEGFLLSSSCSLPLNAKPECLDAMYAAAMD